MGWSKILLAIAAAVATIAIVSFVASILRLYDLQTAANVAQLLSIPLTAAPLLVAVLRWCWTRRGGPDSDASSTQLSEKLAFLVRSQWEPEARNRLLYDPAPMPVHWTAVTVDNRPMGTVCASTEGPNPFAGNSNNAFQLASEFNNLERKRLVVLGEPGTGKTTLAIQLLLSLLRQRNDDDPVPVIASVSDWDLRETPDIREWLALWLQRNYPALRVDGTETLKRLILAGQVLPILDGLDEVSPPVRSGIIRALNYSLTHDDPLILTCRTDAFSRAVAEGDELTAAVLLEAQPLSALDASRYLAACIPSSQAKVWRSTIACLEDRDSSLAQFCTTPLGLWLLRMVYVETRSDPTELVSSNMTAYRLRQHLFSALTKSLVQRQNLPSRAINFNPSKPDRFGRGGWTAAQADRWLTHLATSITNANRRDFRWWELSALTLSRKRLRFMRGLELGLLLAVPIGMFGGLISYWALKAPQSVLLFLLYGAEAGAVLGFIGTATAGLIASRHSGPIKPTYANTRVRGRLGQLVVEILFRLSIALLIVVLAPLFGSKGFDFSATVKIYETGAVALLLAFAVPVALISALNKWLQQSDGREIIQSPRSSLKGDRALTLIQLLTFGLPVGLAVGYALSYFHGAGTALVLGTLAGLTFGFLAGAAQQASSIYAMTVLVQVARRRLPLATMKFLQDAQDLGLLKIVGSTFQFRHAEWQDYLAGMQGSGCSQHTPGAPDVQPGAGSGSLPVRSDII